jgi:transcription elongation regulator 1
LTGAVQNDKRYLMFDHVPEQRERWLRVSTRTDAEHPNRASNCDLLLKDYLSQLAAPKLSVHVPESA